MGSDRQELDKRLAAELIEAQPALFLDNANGIALRSDTLASVLTERPARVRLLGQTRMVLLNSTAFIAVTGNGLTVTEDLARRLNPCQLDARCEDPELRQFGSGFLDQIERRRDELLLACVTILRWGRQNGTQLPRGKPLGSFEVWGEWCRDPLLALGCRDPVERIETLKANDPHRQRIAELFQTWWEYHGATPLKVNQLAEPVKVVADPQGRGRQYLATFIAGLADTHAAGFLLSRQEAAGKWTAATYALTKALSKDSIGHRTDRMGLMSAAMKSCLSVIAQNSTGKDIRCIIALVPVEIASETVIVTFSACAHTTLVLRPSSFCGLAAQLFSASSGGPVTPRSPRTSNALLENGFTAKRNFACSIMNDTMCSGAPLIRTLRLHHRRTGGCFGFTRSLPLTRPVKGWA
jgi:hypothetical protein